MAGGIDWFRWHHGSVTDPKFQLVARRAGASLPDVLAVWAYLLEQASAAKVRGEIGEVDCEALDCLFGFPATETRTADILAAMRERKLLDEARVIAWEKRQPKREREDEGAADRQRAKRERDAAQGKPDAGKSGNVTPRHATSRQKTPREEERREEETSSLRSEGKDSAEPQSDSPPAVVSLPLVDGTDFDVVAAAVAEWRGAYPAVDVEQQLRQMRAWCMANKANRKTRNGIERFIVRWLSKAQDQAPRARAGPAANDPHHHQSIHDRRAATSAALRNPGDNFDDERTFDAESRIVG